MLPSMRGVFRDKEDWARVIFNDGRELDMPRYRYTALKVRPAFEELPFEDESDVAAKGSGRAS
jgi:hypothetical protein